MKRIILSSILVLALCASMITGATFALFTSNSETSISATSGKVEVLATLEKAENDWVYSPTSISTSEGNEITDATNAADVENGMFANKGTASINGGNLVMTGVTPGDTVNLVVKVTNNSNVAIKYRAEISSATGALADAMVVTIDGKTYNGAYNTTWMYANPRAEIADIPVSITLPTTADMQSADFAMTISLVAIQANADTSDEDTSVVAGNAEDLMNIFQSFSGAVEDEVVVQLTGNIDVENAWTPWTPQGYNGVNKLIIDGNGFKIVNLNAPLFSGAFGGAGSIEIRNLTIADSIITGENFNDNDLGMGAFVGYLDSAGDMTLSGCKLINSTVDNTMGVSGTAGGLIGYSSARSNIIVDGCEVSGCEIKGASSVGAIFGHFQVPAATAKISGCTVSDNDLISTKNGSWRVGVLCGTINGVNVLTVVGNTMNDNDRVQTGYETAPEQDNIYGRLYDTVITDGEEN